MHGHVTGENEAFVTECAALRARKSQRGTAVSACNARTCAPAYQRGAREDQ